MTSRLLGHSRTLRWRHRSSCVVWIDLKFCFHFLLMRNTKHHISEKNKKMNDLFLSVISYYIPKILRKKMSSPNGNSIQSDWRCHFRIDSRDSYKKNEIVSVKIIARFCWENFPAKQIRIVSLYIWTMAGDLDRI